MQSHLVFLAEEGSVRIVFEEGLTKRLEFLLKPKKTRCVCKDYTYEIFGKGDVRSM